MKQQEAGRIYIGYEDDPQQEQLSKGRYEFALNFIKEGDICLDAACGSGYGSEMISRIASKVFGLELDDHALEFARSHYQNPKVSFQKANITQHLDLPDNYFDVIVSIETIEHISVQDAMLKEFQRVLKPDGLLVLSTVDHYIYSIKGGIRNKHHTNELTKSELLTLVSKYFNIEQLYGQLRYIPLSLAKVVGKWLWLSFLTILGRLDVLKVRYWIMKTFHLEEAISVVNRGISAMKLSSIDKITPNNKSQYFQLILVARKGI